MYVSTDFKGSNFRFHGDFDLGLTVVAWPIEVTRKNGYIAYLEAPRPCFRAHFRFCSATAVYRPTPAHTRHTPLGPGAVLFDLGLRSPRDHARLFQNRIFCVEIDPKSIYVDILGPHPDRPPPELVKNGRKSRKSQYFRYLSKLLRHGSSSNVTE